MKLYIVHGWAYSIEPWSITVDLLRERGIDVVQLRVPGLTEPSGAVWTIEGYVQWLRESLKDDPNPIVLGHSNGGRIAMHLLAEQPDRFRHLLLLNSAGIELRGATISKKRQVLRTASKILAPLKAVPGLRKVVYRMLKSDYGNAPKNMQQTLQNMLDSDANFDPSPITTPTSLLWGEEDTVTPLAMGQRLHEIIKGSSFKAVPQWRHAPYRTHPEQLADELLAILKAIR